MFADDESLFIGHTLQQRWIPRRGDFGEQGRAPVRNTFGETWGSTAIVEGIVDFNRRGKTSISLTDSIVRVERSDNVHEDVPT